MVNYILPLVITCGYFTVLGMLLFCPEKLRRKKHNEHERNLLINAYVQEDGKPSDEVFKNLKNAGIEINYLKSELSDK